MIETMVVTRRGTTNGNARGGSRDRLARRLWLVRTFCADVWIFKVGDACRCYRCGKLLTIDTVTVDRIVPGCHGGTYRRNNIRPSCASCASETGGSLGAAQAAAQRRR